MQANGVNLLKLSLFDLTKCVQFKIAKVWDIWLRLEHQSLWQRLNILWQPWIWLRFLNFFFDIWQNILIQDFKGVPRPSSFLTFNFGFICKHLFVYNILLDINFVKFEHPLTFPGVMGGPKHKIWSRLVQPFWRL